jgi:hypothetical protein
VPRASVRQAKNVKIVTARAGASSVEQYKVAFGQGSGTYDLTVRSSY